MEKYRIDEFGTVYEHNATQHAYICIGKKLPAESDAEAIKRIEETQLYNMEHNA